ncbi:hypothetical protein B0H19DRAFT_1075160 [Mycena capillaripes]|nr:hypothetical protein B0H19DRAFT_1075160 [Mycena capillaripes]
MPPDIKAIRPFASSSPPPQPLMVSLWATDIHLAESPIPTAHQDIPRFVISAPAGKVASPPKALKIDIPPPVLSTVLSVTMPSAARAVEPAISVPNSPATMDDSPPESPLTDLDQLDVSTSKPKSDPTKIARPSGAARVTLPVLFADWDSKRLDKVQKHIKTLSKTTLNRTNFQNQPREKLREFYRLMDLKFSFLTKYDQHWATARLLQAHLKSKSSSSKNAATKKVVMAATALGAAPLRRTRSQTRPTRVASVHAGDN